MGPQQRKQSRDRTGRGEHGRNDFRAAPVPGKAIGHAEMSGGKLEKLLNEHASQGWRLRAITGADVKGRIGPGRTEGLLVTFERRIA
jgi:Domain of unknown function (DUF4177)